MSAKKKSAAKQPVKARLYKNQSKTAESAPYLMTVEPKGTVGLDDLVAEVQKAMPSVSRPTIVMFLESMVETISEHLRKGCKVETPFGTFEPHISGSFEYVDSPFDPAQNKVEVRVTPPRAWREALSKLNVEIVNTPTSELTLSGVETSSLGRAGVDALKGGEAFTMTGRGFLDGTLAATVIDSSGATHQLSLSLVKSLYAQSTAPVGIAAGQASLVLTLTDAANNTFTASRKVTVV